MAKRYTGLTELDDNLVKPPPPIVEESTHSCQEVSAGDDSDDYEDDNGDSNASPCHGNHGSVCGSDDPDDHEDDSSHSNAYSCHCEHGSQANQSEQERDEVDQEVQEDEENEDDEDQEFRSQPSLVEFFNDPRPKTNRHSWLALFFSISDTPYSRRQETQHPTATQRSQDVATESSEIGFKVTRARPPTNTVSPQTAQQRCRETFEAAMEIHGGTKSNKRPALDGLYQTIAKKCKTSVFGDYVLSNSKVVNYVFNKCKPMELAVFESSKDNVLHSIATY
ncbi:hypothetical protein ACROYT_G015441 [Oculina patagonica]